MTRARLLRWAALGIGIAGMAWGLLALHGIFGAERDAVRDAVAAERAALASYARAALGAELAADLGRAERRVEAVTDSLADVGDVLLVGHGRQLLPRLGPREEQPDDLLDGGGDRPEPELAARERALAALEAAVDRGDTGAVPGLVRDVLAHRVAYRLRAAHDIATSLRLVEALLRQGSPDRELVRSLLLDGLDLGDGIRVHGLQRELIARTDRLGRRDFARLAASITDLSRRAGVPVDAFERTVDALCDAPVPIGQQDGPALVDGWYVEPRGDGRAIGIRAKLGPRLEAMSARMREAGLLDAGGAVTAGEGLAPEIRSPAMAQRIKSADARYAWKNLLLGGTGVLALGVVAMLLWVQRRARRYVELKNAFVASVTHELKTPLASVRALAETLERRTEGVPGVRDYPSRIVRDVDGLAFLVDNVLSYGRLERGAWDPRPERVRVADVVARATAHTDAFTGAEVIVDAEGLGAVELAADPALLELTLRNLVSNACKYTRRDPVELRFTAREAPDEVVIAVRDNGVGIPEADRDHVFEDFYRGAPELDGATRGSGLGLAICARIMRAHGGSIRVADTGAGGTSFELRFPR